MHEMSRSSKHFTALLSNSINPHYFFLSENTVMNLEATATLSDVYPDVGQSNLMVISTLVCFVQIQKYYLTTSLSSGLGTPSLQCEQIDSS
jgi:hypothetical protein